MTGFTGLDPSRAKNNIFQFQQACAGVRDHFFYAIYDLYEELSVSWCSPVAAEFGNTFAPKFQNLYKEFGIYANKIARGAQRAYNIAATAQGLPGIAVEEETDGGGYTLVNSLKEANPEGIVGMNHQLVERSIDAFTTKMNSVIGEIDSIPRSIALYDTEDGQKSAFSTSISQFSSKFKAFIDELVNSLRQKALEEEENIMLAKQKATDTLSA